MKRERVRVPRELVTVLSERIPAAAAEIHWETGKDARLQRPLSRGDLPVICTEAAVPSQATSNWSYAKIR